MAAPPVPEMFATTGEITRNRRLLIVDDNPTIHDDFRKILGPRRSNTSTDSLLAEVFGRTVAPSVEPFDIDSAYQGQEALTKVQESVQSDRRYALAFVDMRMPPGWDGVQTIEKLWDVDPDLQIVICTAYSDYSWEDLLRRFGTADRLLILKKPFDTAEVSQLATALTEKWFLARHAHLKLQQLRSMVDERTRDLAQAEERYALAIAGANDGLWDWNIDAGDAFFSARWNGMLGLPATDGRAPIEHWLDRVHQEERERVRAELAAHMAGHVPQFAIEHRMRHADGQYRWVLTRGQAIRDAAGRAHRIAGSQTDMTDRKLAEEQLRFDSYHDKLTGLPNRRLLSERLERALLRGTRDPAHRVGLLFVDLDGFKRVNDTLGHLAGDRVLVEVAKRLASSVRNTDTVSVERDPCVTRIGGDEFVVLLDSVSQPADTFRVADRMLLAGRAPLQVEGQEIFAGLSIGIALSDPGTSADEMLRNADVALHHAKTSGKGRYVLFNPEMHETALARWQLEMDLRRAIERDELRLYFQPICSVTSEAPTTFEALLRWQHPTQGLVPPDAFIPLAEESGLIVPVGTWVIREACRQIRAWKDVMPDAREVTVSVNVSSKQLVGTKLVEDTRSILDETGVSPSALQLEITESVVMENAVAALGVLDELRALGIQIHLDDFGTGHSSLSRLHHMPIDALKIDRSFVEKMAHDPASAELVRVIIALAHTLGLHAIAEGVETSEQLAMLRNMSCDLAQGYLFAHPQDAEKTLQLLSGQPVSYELSSSLEGMEGTG